MAIAIVEDLILAKNLIPIVEAIVTRIGPVIKQEIADGEAIWAAIEKGISDAKTGFQTVETVAKQSGKL